ncbi:MAG: hypothetical protein IKH54_06365 [Bacilli bacterium]|nr:hypothetical protein [Bacilli bacterium]
MNKFFKHIFILFLSFVFLLPFDTLAKENNVTIYFFHGDGCPHCAAEEEYLKKLDDVKIVRYEVWYDSSNEEFMQKVKDSFGIDKSGVPLTIIGNSYFIGYSESSDETFNRAINYYKKSDKYVDQVKKIKNDTFNKDELVDYFDIEDRKSNESLSLNIPIIGKVNLKAISISSAAVIIGFIDGFNPCAMWVLLFLISMLIGMKNKKRMWALGITFLVTSALVYMIIMFSWLNIVVRLSTSILIRNIIAIVAIIGGLINLKSYVTSNSSGCEVVDDNKRKKIFSEIKKFTHEKSFLLALAGVVVLAISVNMIELACSAGLPLVFTQLLAVNNITGFAGFIYTLIYIFFFLIDDLLVFFIAMATMKVTGISTKYNKYSHLIGGIIMLIIGILLMVKPELLMFNF